MAKDIVFDSTSPYITLFSKNLKKNKADMRIVNASVSQSGSTFIFDLFPITNRFFDRKNFVLAPGCLLVYDGHEFVTTDIQYAPYPRYVSISARQVA